MTEKTVLRSEIAEKMSLDQVRYAQVWEDHALLEEGLQIDENDDVLSICSAGCNALALLLQGPKTVTAVDMNPAQIALLELKLASISELTYDGFTQLIGVCSSTDRRELYGTVRVVLSPMARRFWDEHLNHIETGVIHCGRLESYFRRFQTDYLSKIWPPDLFRRLHGAQNLKAQVALLRAEALTPEFEAAFRQYFGRENMAAQGRDPAQFEHVENHDVGLYFYERFVHACTTLPLVTNFYIAHFLTAEYPALDIGPPYLRPENFDRLKRLIDRVELKVCEIEQVLYTGAHGRFSKANLSDIFEYMSEALAENVFRALGERLRTNGRIAYWNLLVPRQSPPELASYFTHMSDLSHRLWRRDRSWFYRAFHIEQVHRCAG
ncbi:MAG: DUF3419 family protein [Myxococcota bacterium]|nr:DUF3419 family protein [Myxococcota bacterium]